MTAARASRRSAGKGEPAQLEAGSPTLAAVDAERVAAEYVPLNAVHPWPDNPRWKDKKKLQKAVRVLTKSIRRFGFGEPILARKANGEIIAGHTRYMAAGRLSLTRIPVRFMDLSESEAHALALADNKIAEFGQWDDEKLGAVMRELEDNDVDLDLGTGFEDEEIEELLGLGDSGLLEGDASTSEKLAPVWGVILECKDEAQQVKALAELSAQGYKVRALVGG